MYNHLQKTIELLATLPMSSPMVQGTIEPGDLYSVPFGVAFTGELGVRPKDFGYDLLLFYYRKFLIKL